MQLIAPDILELAHGLSLPLAVAGLVLGFFLWLTGWWAHRFWIVLVATVMAGIFGLSKGPVLRVQPLVAGLLLAVAVGVLALALVRVVAFAAGGIASWVIVQSVAPVAWHEPLVCFLAGGLIALLLFRLWTMVLTSFVATVLMGHFGLLLAEQLGKVNAVEMASERRVLLNWVCAMMVLIGFAAQYLLERRRIKKKFDREEFENAGPERRRRYQPEDKRTFWSLGRRSYRRAG